MYVFVCMPAIVSVDVYLSMSDYVFLKSKYIWLTLSRLSHTKTKATGRWQQSRQTQLTDFHDGSTTTAMFSLHHYIYDYIYLISFSFAPFCLSSGNCGSMFCCASLVFTCILLLDRTCMCMRCGSTCKSHFIDVDVWYTQKTQLTDIHDGSATTVMLMLHH